jgi:HAD superfamily hydrolase (TIGR01509 family)
MKLKPGAILFDMDGVLVDSLDSWWLSLNTALKKYNHNAMSKEEFLNKYWGHDLYDNIKKMNLPLEVGRFCNIIYGKNINKIKIYEETRDTLQKLNSYKKAIITNTPKDCTIQILKRFDIEKYFEFVMTSDDVKMAKPNPEIVIKACKKIKVNPENVLLVGDTDSDVEAGREAGCKVIGININADYTIKNISELTTLIVH